MNDFDDDKVAMTAGAKSMVKLLILVQDYVMDLKIFMNFMHVVF